MLRGGAAGFRQRCLFWLERGREAEAICPLVRGMELVRGEMMDGHPAFAETDAERGG